jgi:hypothetical protein
MTRTYSLKTKQRVINLFKENPNRPTREVMELVKLSKGQVLGIKHRAKLCNYTPHLQGIPKLSSYRHVIDTEYKPRVDQHTLSKSRLRAALKINLSYLLEKTKSLLI